MKPLLRSGKRSWRRTTTNMTAAGFHFRKALLRPVKQQGPVWESHLTAEQANMLLVQPIVIAQPPVAQLLPLAIEDAAP